MEDILNQKILQTRIKLRYDSYENWIDESKEEHGANLVLLPGEIGLCEIPDTTKTVVEGDRSVNITTGATLLFKVGSEDGKAFKDLPWASAKAADVYSWAKAATKPEYTAEEVGALPNTTVIPSIDGLASEEYVDGRVNNVEVSLEAISTNVGLNAEEIKTKFDKSGGTITGDVAIQGDLSVSGITVTKDVESLLVKDNIIVTNSDGIEINTDLSGFVIRKDESVAYGIMYDNTRNGVAVGEGKLDENNKFTYGYYNADGNFIEDLHEGQLLATRKEDIINNRIVVWDAENYTLKDGGCGVYDILGRIDVADAAIVAVSKEVENKQDKLTFDSTPTAGSNNPVTSDGIKKAIDNIEIGSGVDLPLSKGSGGYGAFQQTNGNNASGAGSIALGANTISAGNYGFTRGGSTKNTGAYGEAAGNRCQNFVTDGYCGGDSSRNMSTAGFVHGSYLNTDGTFEEGMENSDLNKAIPSGQAVFGSLNARNNNALMIVGNGVGDDTTSPLYGRYNAFEVLKDGRARVQAGPKEDKDIVNLKFLKDEDIYDDSSEVIKADEGIVLDRLSGGILSWTVLKIVGFEGWTSVHNIDTGSIYYPADNNPYIMWNKGDGTSGTAVLYGAKSIGTSNTLFSVGTSPYSSPDPANNLSWWSASSVQDISKSNVTHIYGTNAVRGVDGYIELPNTVEYVENLSGNILKLNRKLPMQLGGTLTFDKIVVPDRSVKTYRLNWPQYADIIISNEDYELSLKFYTKEEIDKTFMKISDLNSSFFETLYN